MAPFLGCPGRSPAPQMGGEWGMVLYACAGAVSGRPYGSCPLRLAQVAGACFLQVLREAPSCTAILWGCGGRVCFLVLGRLALPPSSPSVGPQRPFVDCSAECRQGEAVHYPLSSVNILVCSKCPGAQSPHHLCGAGSSQCLLPLQQTHVRLGNLLALPWNDVVLGERLP